MPDESRPYLDTSALAKWYLNEPRSEDFAAFIQQQSSAVISRLTVLEFRCLLARRRRSRQIGQSLERRVFAAFEKDIRDGVLNVRALQDHHAWAALDLINRLERHALRTLDALHLAIALDERCATIATADRAFAAAAESLGMEVARFD